MKKCLTIFYVMFLIVLMCGGANGATSGYLLSSESLSLNGVGYEIYALGTFNGTSLSISDAMQIVGDGISYKSINVFSDGGLVSIDVETRYNKATAINNAGQVAGYGYNASGVMTSYISDNGSTRTIEVLWGGASYVKALNSLGQAAGNYKTQAGTTHAFLYDGSETLDIGTFDGGGFSVANDLNDQGGVVGYGSTASGDVHAFVYSGDSGTIEDIGTLGGDNSYGYAINSDGDAVGASDTAEGDTHAFFFDGDEMYDLGTLGGGSSKALGINDADEIVGTAQTDGGSYHAFYYCGDALVDLSGLLSEDSEWDYLIAAYDINNLGQIVGVGMMDGVITAFLLSPEGLTQVPIPGSCMLLGSCFLAAGIVRRKNARK